MNYNENYFIIRTYTKAELAHLYNPNVCLKVALQIPGSYAALLNKKLSLP